MEKAEDGHCDREIPVKTGNEAGSAEVPSYMDLEHGSTVVVATNPYELAYIMAWCVEKGKSITPFISQYNKFPFCIAVSGNIVGWTDSMNRALYYKPFMEFVSEI